MANDIILKTKNLRKTFSSKKAKVEAVKGLL